MISSRRFTHCCPYDSPTEARTTEPRMGLLSEWTQPRMGLNPEWDWTPNGLNPEWTQPRMGLSSVHSGFSPFGVQSIQGWVHSGLGPFEVQSIRGSVHSRFSPFEVQSIRGSVHSKLSLSRFGHSRFSRWIAHTVLSWAQCVQHM